MEIRNRKESDIDQLLNEELKDPSFAKAWEETEAEDQAKRMMIREEKERE